MLRSTSKSWQTYQNYIKLLQLIVTRTYCNVKIESALLGVAMCSLGQNFVCTQGNAGTLWRVARDLCGPAIRGASWRSKGWQSQGKSQELQKFPGFQQGKGIQWERCSWIFYSRKLWWKQMLGVTVLQNGLWYVYSTILNWRSLFIRRIYNIQLYTYVCTLFFGYIMAIARFSIPFPIATSLIELVLTASVASKYCFIFYYFVVFLRIHICGDNWFPFYSSMSYLYATYWRYILL